MKRRLINLIAAASLLLFAAVLLSWLRSYLPEQLNVRSHDGRVLLIFWARQWTNLFDPDTRLSTDEVLQTIATYTQSDPSPVHARFAGFEAALSDRHTGFWMFPVPHWAAALPPAALAAWALWLARRPARRAARGLCPSCGYDLRGTKDRCPECGAPAAAPGG